MTTRYDGASTAEKEAETAMKARKILKKVGILLAIVLIVSAANFIIFGAQTRMFQLPFELATRSGGHVIASYDSPDGQYRADVYQYDETSMSRVGLRVRIEPKDGKSAGWNVAYLYNYELYNFGDNYHELHWVDNDTISINNIVLDIHHMTYSDLIQNKEPPHLQQTEVRRIFFTLPARESSPDSLRSRSSSRQSCRRA